MSKKNQVVGALTIPQIFTASTKILENAQELVEEATLLLEHNRYARAFALAHLASEELVKFQLLFPVALELARDHRIDWKQVDKTLRNHHAKIRGGILLDFMREPPQDGIYQASDLSQRMSASGTLNDMKNWSLYTSLIDHDFVKPSECINAQTATACVASVHEQLQIFQMVYAAVLALTEMTEEGLRRCVAMPEFQLMFQALGSNADLSHLPTPTKEQAMAEITAAFNHPTVRPLVAQFSSIVEQMLHFLNQAESQTRQDEQQTL